VKRRTKIALISMAAGATAALTALLLWHFLATGEFGMPSGDDLVQIKRKLAGKPDEGAPKIIYLHRGPIHLTGGDDDSTKGMSSIVASFGHKAVDLPGFNGTDKRWRDIVACVKTKFAPFDVAVTEQRPVGGNYILVAVGGSPKDAGIAKEVGGLAPFSGDIVPRAVVLAFARKLGNRLRETCDVIGMEVAHAYGLDHEYDCHDVMTYRSYCGTKKFIDKDVACGEQKKRACAGGKPTQNSFRMLLAALGPAKPAVSAGPAE
jgi:hypothetical protein